MNLPLDTQWTPELGEPVIVWTVGLPTSSAYRQELEAAGLDPETTPYPQGGLVIASDFFLGPGDEPMVMIAWAVEYRSAQREERPVRAQPYPARHVMPHAQGEELSGHEEDHREDTAAV